MTAAVCDCGGYCDCGFVSESTMKLHRIETQGKSWLVYAEDNTAAAKLWAKSEPDLAKLTIMVHPIHEQLIVRER